MIEDEQEEQQEPTPADPEAWLGATPKQAAFLTALVFYAGHHSNAAKAAKVSRSLTYRWLESDETFQKLYAIADKRAFRTLEDEMIRRAKDGVPKGIYFQGDKVATERVYSDGLMMMLARAGDPKYRTSTTEHTGEVALKFHGELTELLGLYRKLTQMESAAA